MSKPMLLGDTTENEIIFPTPPSKPQDIEFRLVRHVWIRANKYTGASASEGEELALLGGLGSGSDPSEHLVVQPLERVWVPDDDDKKKKKGRWKQEVEIQSMFALTCAPSFTTDTMQVRVRGGSCGLHRFTATDAVRTVSVDTEHSFPGHRE